MSFATRRPTAGCLRGVDFFADGAEAAALRFLLGGVCGQMASFRACAGLRLILSGFDAAAALVFPVRVAASLAARSFHRLILASGFLSLRSCAVPVRATAAAAAAAGAAAFFAEGAVRVRAPRFAGARSAGRHAPLPFVVAFRRKTGLTN